MSKQDDHPNANAERARRAALNPASIGAPGLLTDLHQLGAERDREREERFAFDRRVQALSFAVGLKGGFGETDDSIVARAAAFERFLRGEEAK